MTTPQRGSLDNMRRRQEVAYMEACHIPRATSDRNLRAAFQAGEHQEGEIVTPAFTTNGYATAGISNFQHFEPVPSASVSRSSTRQDSVTIEQRRRYNTNRFLPVPLQSFQEPEPVPTRHARNPTNPDIISTEQVWRSITQDMHSVFPNQPARPSSSSSSSEDTIVELDSTLIVYEDRSAQNQELNQRNYESDSSYVQSIRPTIGNPYQHNYEDRDRQRLTQTESNTDSDTIQVPNDECDTTLIGFQCAKQYINQGTSSSHYPGRNDVDKPVVRKFVLQVLDKVQSRGNQIADAVKLRLSKTKARAGDDDT